MNTVDISTFIVYVASGFDVAPLDSTQEEMLYRLDAYINYINAAASETGKTGNPYNNVFYDEIFYPSDSGIVDDLATMQRIIGGKGLSLSLAGNNNSTRTLMLSLSANTSPPPITSSSSYDDAIKYVNAVKRVKQRGVNPAFRFTADMSLWLNDPTFVQRYFTDDDITNYVSQIRLPDASGMPERRQQQVSIPSQQYIAPPINVIAGGPQTDVRKTYPDVENIDKETDQEDDDADDLINETDNNRDNLPYLDDRSVISAYQPSEYEGGVLDEIAYDEEDEGEGGSDKTLTFDPDIPIVTSEEESVGIYVSDIATNNITTIEPLSIALLKLWQLVLADSPLYNELARNRRLLRQQNSLLSTYDLVARLSQAGRGVEVDTFIAIWKLPSISNILDDIDQMRRDLENTSSSISQVEDQIHLRDTIVVQLKTLLQQALSFGDIAPIIPRQLQEKTYRLVIDDIGIMSPDDLSTALIDTNLAETTPSDTPERDRGIAFCPPSRGCKYPIVPALRDAIKDVTINTPERDLDQLIADSRVLMPPELPTSLNTKVDKINYLLSL